jgi:hypothetical protein
MSQKWNCRLCGLGNLDAPHSGSVDCIAYYRRWVEHLNNLLPEGREVLRASISRESDARVWIAGEITYESLERLITFIRFMQEAWTEPFAMYAETETKATVAD